MDQIFLFEVAVSKAFQMLEEGGLGREGLLVLAGKLQEELTCDTRNKRYPHATSLELIMRAVIAVLKGNPENFPDYKGYVFENLEPGVRGLATELK